MKTRKKTLDFADKLDQKGENQAEENV